MPYLNLVSGDPSIPTFSPCMNHFGSTDSLSFHSKGCRGPGCLRALLHPDLLSAGHRSAPSLSLLASPTPSLCLPLPCFSLKNFIISLVSLCVCGW